MIKQSRGGNNAVIIASLFAGIFIVAGMVSVYFGTYFYTDIQSIRKGGVKTEGVILRYERRGTRSANMKDMFVVPIVQFQTVAGQLIVVEGKVDNSTILQNLCESGEQVEIIYDPNNPEHAVINTFAELWFLPLLLWIIGAGFISVPPFTIWRHCKGRGNS